LFFIYFKRQTNRQTFEIKLQKKTVNIINQSIFYYYLKVMLILKFSQFY